MSKDKAEVKTRVQGINKRPTRFALSVGLVVVVRDGVQHFVQSVLRVAGVVEGDLMKPELYVSCLGYKVWFKSSH